MARPKTHNPKSPRRQQLLLAGGVVLVVLIIGLMVTNRAGAKRNTATTITPSPTTTVSTSPTTSPVTGGQATIMPTPATTVTATPAPLDAPLLSMSSGNNGSVPSGAVIEFVCRTTSQQSCLINLTNGSKVQTLTAKTTQDDGRGVFGATWDWTSTSGSWSVLATAQKGTQKASSTKLTLVVE